MDADGTGSLTEDEVAELVRRVAPGAPAGVAGAVQAMLDADGDGRMTYAELTTGLRSILEARAEARTGSPAADAALARIAAFVRGDRDRLRRVFADLGGADDGQVTLPEAVRALKPLLPDLGPADVRHLVNRLMAVDVDGSGTLSFAEFAAAVGA